MKVLLIIGPDDTDESMIRNCLNLHGHLVETVRNGDEALEKVKENRFDGLLAGDIGPDLVKGLAKSSGPIMVMTAYGYETAIAAGASEFIKRPPLLIEELEVRFNKMLHQHRMEQGYFSDGLTGLPTRRRFMILAEDQLNAAICRKQKLNFFFVDLDGLKTINDTYGHSKGDAILTEASGILRKTFRRRSDTLGRVGGDEFAIISGENDEVLKARLEKNMVYRNARGNGQPLSLSVGTIPFDPEHPVSVRELLKQADALMYEQKRRKQRVSV